MNDHENMKSTNKFNLRVALILTILGTAFLLLISTLVFVYNSQKYGRALNKSSDTPRAEAQLQETNNVQKPKPFSYEIKDLPPSGFKLSKLLLNRKKNYPNNIQEIIEEQTESSIKLTAYSDDFIPNNAQNDRFFRYKPLDVSQINLMAMSNLRFAPPLWKNFMKKERQHLGSVIILERPEYKNNPAHKTPKTYSNAKEMPKFEPSSVVDVQEVEVVEVVGVP